MVIKKINSTQSTRPPVKLDVLKIIDIQMPNMRIDCGNFGYLRKCKLQIYCYVHAGHLRVIISKKRNITHLYILLKSYKTVTPQWTRADERDQLLILASRKLASDELPRTRRAHYLPQSVTPQSAKNTHTLSQRNISNYPNQSLLQQCTHQLAKTW